MSGAPGVGKINPELFRALEGMELSAEVVQQLKKSARKTQTEEDFKRTLEKLWLSKSNEKRGTGSQRNRVKLLAGAARIFSASSQAANESSLS